MDDKERLVEFYANLSPEVLKWALPPYDRPRVERLFSNPQQLIGIVAEDGGRIVGHLQIFRSYSRMSHLGELIIYLDQNYLNVGLGTAMTRAGLALARERGLHRVQLTVIRGNENAIHVYERAGFKIEGARVDAYLGEDGKFHDGVEMGIILK
jgi:RimJ/RimL family protein N-acetyltransferase